MRVVVARGRNAAIATDALAPIGVAIHDFVVSHSNGLQVGLLALKWIAPRAEGGWTFWARRPRV